MTTEPGRPGEKGQGTDLAAAARRMWALGNQHKVSMDVLGGVEDRLVEARGIGRGQRVLDVAAGSGNVAIAAAEAGARVVASDLTPALFVPGRVSTLREN